MPKRQRIWRSVAHDSCYESLLFSIIKKRLASLVDEEVAINQAAPIVDIDEAASVSSIHHSHSQNGVVRVSRAQYASR